MVCAIRLLNCSDWGTREPFSREIIQNQVHVSAVLKPALQPLKKKKSSTWGGVETQFLHVILKLLALNSEIGCLCLWSTGIKGV